MILPCSVQNLITNESLKWVLWTNEIWREFALIWIRRDVEIVPGGKSVALPCRVLVWHPGQTPCWVFFVSPWPSTRCIIFRKKHKNTFHLPSVLFHNIGMAQVLENFSRRGYVPLYHTKSMAWLLGCWWPGAAVEMTLSLFVQNIPVSVLEFRWHFAGLYHFNSLRPRDAYMRQ